MLIILAIICFAILPVWLPMWGATWAFVLGGWILMGIFPKSPSAKVLRVCWAVIAAILTLSAVGEFLDTRKE